MVNIGLLAALLSGVLSYAATFLPNSLGVHWGAGVLFGVLVLAPSQRGTPLRIALVALSAASYRVAVWLAETLHTEAGWPAVAACVLAGVAGVLLVSLGTSALVRARANLRSIALAAIAGVLAGILFGLFVEADDESLGQQVLLLAGYVTWQAGYAAAHRLPGAFGRA